MQPYDGGFDFWAGNLGFKTEIDELDWINSVNRLEDNSFITKPKGGFNVINV